MKIKSVGVVLSYYREKYKLTLNQVCDGICSASTLMRLEDGVRCVDSLTSSLLLERIGKEVCQFEQLLNDQDYDLWRARESILEHMQKKDYVRVREELLHYRKMENFNSDLHEQFCLYQEVVMLVGDLEEGNLKQQEIWEKVYKTAREALQITKHGTVFEDYRKKQLYTTTEAKLILILIHYARNKMYIRQEEILLDLFHHIKYYDTERRKRELGSKILLEIIDLAQKQQDFDKVLSYTDQGIDYVSQGSACAGLEQFRFLRARILLTRYGADALKDDIRRHEIQKECLMAYSICEVFGDRQQIKVIERFCEEDLKWQITELVM